jgi:pimeloyl-ACP methyl ester carboxylesterase
LLAATNQDYFEMRKTLYWFQTLILFFVVPVHHAFSSWELMINNNNNNNSQKRNQIRSTHKHRNDNRRILLDGSRSSSSSCSSQTPTSSSSSSSSSDETSLKYYSFDGWNLSYRTIASHASDDDEHNNKKGKVSSPAANHKLLLIHPVGVGLASWFWGPFLNSINDDRDKNNNNDEDIKIMETKKAHSYYAPNLIGCGISEGSDAWDPNKRGLFIPLGWVRGCEAFMNHIDDSIYDDDDDDDDDNNISKNNSSWTVVTQGGLAPIGILLADRNPKLVRRLVLTSPPTWEDITTAVPENELERNYNFLRSPILGKLAFLLLESRKAIEFFSNQFLFSNKCDNVWLDKTEQEFRVDARPPVQVFNAGMCMNRGLQSELTTLEQSTLIIQGEDDKRQRQEYSKNMKNCQLVILPGQNVVPWEYPKAMANHLEDWIECNN